MSSYRQTNHSSGAEYSIISVHKFEDLIVPRFFWFDFSADKVDEMSTGIEYRVNEKERLTVGSILVEHERVTSLDLSFEDRVPELLSRHRLLGASFLLVLVEESFELVAVDFVKSGSFSGAEERPVTVLFDTLHEEIGDPESEEEITGTNFLLSVILSKVEEFENVCVPRFEVDSESSWTFVSSLIDVTSRVVVNTEHGDDTVRVTVGSSDVRTSRTNVVNRETDPSCSFRDEGASLEGVVDTFDRVVLHSDEEARRELRVRSSSVEEGRRSVGEVSFRHEVVGLKCSINIASVDTNSDTHKHVLRSFSYSAIDSEKVRTFESLETEVVLFS